MYPRYQLMKTLQDERLRAAARGHLAAEARRARTAGRDHAAATRAGATARGAATMPRRQGATIGLGIPLGAILLFPQGIIPAVLKLARARGRMWFLPLYLPKPLQWPACLVMIILGAAVYCYVLWTMRQQKKSSREIHTGKGGGRSPKSAPTRIGTGQDLGGTPRDASAAHAPNAQISISGSVALRSTLAAQIGGSRAHQARANCAALQDDRLRRPRCVCAPIACGASWRAGDETSGCAQPVTGAEQAGVAVTAPQQPPSAVALRVRAGYERSS